MENLKQISSTFDLLKKIKNTGLIVNENKTIHVHDEKSDRYAKPWNEKLLIQTDRNFKYLGVNINQKNNMHNEIILWLVLANRGYHTMRNILSLRWLSRETKMKLFVIYLHPIHAKLGQKKNKCYDQKHIIFLRKILRKIYDFTQPVIRKSRKKKKMQRSKEFTINKLI